MAPAGRLELVTMNQSRCSDRGQSALKVKVEKHGNTVQRFDRLRNDYFVLLTSGCSE